MIPLDKHDLAMLHVLSSKELMAQAIKAAKQGADIFRRQHLALIWKTLIRFALQSKKDGTWLLQSS